MPLEPTHAPVKSPSPIAGAAAVAYASPPACTTVSAGIAAASTKAAPLIDPAVAVVAIRAETRTGYLVRYVETNPQCAISGIEGEEREFSTPKQGRDSVGVAAGGALRDIVGSQNKEDMKKLVLPMLRQASERNTVDVAPELVAAAVAKLPPDIVKKYPEADIKAAITAFMQGAAQKIITEAKAATDRAAVAKFIADKIFSDKMTYAQGAACVVLGEANCGTDRNDVGELASSDSSADDDTDIGGGSIIPAQALSLDRLSLAPQPSYRIYGDGHTTYTPQVSIGATLRFAPVTIASTVSLKIHLP